MFQKQDASPAIILRILEHETETRRKERKFKNES